MAFLLHGRRTCRRIQWLAFTSMAETKQCNDSVVMLSSFQIPFAYTLLLVIKVKPSMRRQLSLFKVWFQASKSRSPDSGLSRGAIPIGKQVKTGSSHHPLAIIC